MFIIVDNFQIVVQMNQVIKVMSQVKIFFVECGKIFKQSIFSVIGGEFNNIIFVIGSDQLVLIIVIFNMIMLSCQKKLFEIEDK